MWLHQGLRRIFVHQLHQKSAELTSSVVTASRDALSGGHRLHHDEQLNSDGVRARIWCARRKVLNETRI
jgi:hypothetical protein